MQEANTVYLNSNEHARATINVETRTARFNNWCQKKYNEHHYEKAAPLMHELRAIKHPFRNRFVTTRLQYHRKRI